MAARCQQSGCEIVDLINMASSRTDMVAAMRLVADHLRDHPEERELRQAANELIIRAIAAGVRFRSARPPTNGAKRSPRRAQRVPSTSAA